jgi:cyclohexyl-isocyanide hydratase
MNDEEVLLLFEVSLLRADWCSQFVNGSFAMRRGRGPRGRHATAHWASVRSRVVVDGNLVTAGGVTVGLDRCFGCRLVVAWGCNCQEIQLSGQYAANPVFHSGTPETAPGEVLQAFREAIHPSQYPEKPKRGGSRPFWASLSRLVPLFFCEIK